MNDFVEKNFFGFPKNSQHVVSLHIQSKTF